MFNKDKYGKILVPMVTPFKDDEQQSVDYEGAVSIAKRLIKENKADSIVLSGTTGEFFSMTYDERVKLLEIMMKEVGKDIPLIAGTGCNSTVETIKLSQKAEELGYELIMVISPYFTKPNQEALIKHFNKVAESVEISILLYNIPIFTGVNIYPETLAKLAEVNNIVGIKEESELNPKQVTEFINKTPEDFIIYNGDDTMVLECFAQGGEKRVGGVVSGASHLIGNQIREMINSFLSGNVEKASKMQQQFLPFYRVMGQNNRTNPVSLIKDAMAKINYNSGIPRLPLMPATNLEKENIDRIMKELNILSD